MPTRIHEAAASIHDGSPSIHKKTPPMEFLGSVGGFFGYIASQLYFPSKSYIAPLSQLYFLQSKKLSLAG